MNKIKIIKYSCQKITNKESKKTKLADIYISI